MHVYWSAVCLVFGITLSILKTVSVWCLKNIKCSSFGNCKLSANSFSKLGITLHTNFQTTFYCKRICIDCSKIKKSQHQHHQNSLQSNCRKKIIKVNNEISLFVNIVFTTN